MVTDVIDKIKPPQNPSNTPRGRKTYVSHIPLMPGKPIQDMFVVGGMFLYPRLLYAIMVNLYHNPLYLIFQINYFFLSHLLLYTEEFHNQLHKYLLLFYQ